MAHSLGMSQSLMRNEGFETPIRSNLAQFDWNLSQSKYAKIGITTATARTGQRSLKISYNDIDTTTLDNEIRQLVKARPGARYTDVLRQSGEVGYPRRAAGRRNLTRFLDAHSRLGGD